MITFTDNAAASALAVAAVLWSLVAKFTPIIALWTADKLLAPAMVAVFFSGLTNIYIDRWKADRDQTSKLTDGLRTDLGVLQSLASEYWGRAGKKSDVIIEAKIVALQTDALETIALLAATYSLKIADDDGLTNLIDVITGGEFGSATRKADLKRSAESFKLISSMRSRVQAERLSRFRKTGQ